MIPYVIKTRQFIQVNDPAAKNRLFSYRVVPTRGTEILIETGALAKQVEILGSISCPVLMMISTGDMAASPEKAKEAFALIPPREQDHFR